MNLQDYCCLQDIDAEKYFDGVLPGKEVKNYVINRYTEKQKGLLLYNHINLKGVLVLDSIS